LHVIQKFKQKLDNKYKNTYKNKNKTQLTEKIKITPSKTLKNSPIMIYYKNKLQELMDR